MCGRYSIVNPKDIYSRFDIPKNEQVLEKPNYNIAPGGNLPIIKKTDKNHLKIAHWGLIPQWAKDSSIGYKMINARSETLSEKPSFRKPLANNRCIVPASGFFEWDRQGKEKIPFYIQPQNDNLFSFAGLCETWEGKNSEKIDSFSIITKNAEGEISKIHNRMPVILNDKEIEIWLDNTQKDPEMLGDILRNTRTNYKIHQVSEDANKPENNTKEILNPVY